MADSIDDKIAQAARVLKAAGAREVYVFGSAVKRQGPPADVDMAVSGLPPGVLFKAYAGAGDVLGGPLDLIDLDEGTPFVTYLKEEGELMRVG